MPIVWNPENEAKLLAGLFKVCDIKVGGPQLKELAALMGPDCTPKAVTHRLAKFRKNAGAFNGGKKGGDAAAEDVESESGAEDTPKSKKDGKFGKKREAREATDDDEERVEKKVKAEDSDDYQ